MRSLRNASFGAFPSLASFIRNSISFTTSFSPVSSPSLVLLGCRCLSTSSSRLFVGGLSWGVDERSLRDAFSSFGDVTEVRIIYDRDSGRTRGFGFVYFSNEEDAKSAKDAMDGKKFLLSNRHCWVGLCG
ncbi:glycine-rich RNA-binding protein 4, mitochondrial-like isoform X2 [Nymphaea colorata]|uniref:glycine-rich RNA-binding protein 4, mitochondrial-like isoform X2 n=1 Tax=Nymphaea colorata TaxID=210225 RepID=UPI00214EE628|nr:glycine-rich RNA-binding protein 4, mitochondrial-like isoform X2 [Nymphaea colorata]